LEFGIGLRYLNRPLIVQPRSSNTAKIAPNGNSEIKESMNVGSAHISKTIKASQMDPKAISQFHARSSRRRRWSTE
jgi:hypothetical protein